MHQPLPPNESNEGRRFIAAHPTIDGVGLGPSVFPAVLSAYIATLCVRARSAAALAQFWTKIFEADFAPSGPHPCGGNRIKPKY
jgi:hypothetical protein